MASSAPKAGRNVRKLEAQRVNKGLILGGLSVFLAVVAIVMILLTPAAVLFASPLVFLSIFIGVRLNQQSLLVFNARRGAQAEERVGEVLEAHLPDWHIFHNVLVPQLGDIDHLLIGPGGVVLVETKSQRGVVVAARGRVGFRQPLGVRWSRKDFVAQTRHLSEALRAKGLAVNAFLCFPFAEVSPFKLKGVTLVDLESLLTRVQNLPSTYSSAEINEACALVQQWC